MNIFETTIEKMVYGGYGLARTDSGVVFISDVLPGEVVRATIESRSRGMTTARLVEIVKSSAFRRTPQCSYAGECGGCDWLHIGYEEQLQIKKEVFQDCIRRIGKIQIPEPQIFRSPENNYRLRAQIKVDKDNGAGFFKKKTNKIVKICRCPLLTDALNKLFVNGAFKDLHPEKTINFKAIAGQDGVASFPPIPGFTSDKTTIKAGKFLFEVSGNSFFQSNHFLLENLGQWAIDDVGGRSCVDLYGGTGFFSVMLAQRFKEGLLVESEQGQVVEARRNFLLNNINNFKAVKATAEQVSGVVESNPDLVIIDPPRPGLSPKALEQVGKLLPGKILYVSCNPSTQARDAAFFVKRAGYSVTKTALFDLYPNTFHLETVMLFCRRC